MTSVWKVRVSMLLMLLYLVAVTGCKVPGALGKGAVSLGGISVYQSIGGSGLKTQEIFQRKGVGRVIIVGQKAITGGGEMVNVETLATEIKQRIPDQNDQVLVVLDWEGSVMKRILSGALEKTEEWYELIARYDQAYEVVKSLRPQTTVGFYGYPERRYWNRSDDWLRRNRELDEAFRNYDALFPSVYDFYSSDATNGRGDLRYVEDNVVEAIAMGKRIGKPVFPLVWHRYHDSNKDLALKLIPIPEFEEHIAALGRTRFEGEAVDGVIWWAAEAYHFNKANTQLTDKALRKQAFQEKSDSYLPQYLAAIFRALSRTVEK